MRLAVDQPFRLKFLEPFNQHTIGAFGDSARNILKARRPILHEDLKNQAHPFLTKNDKCFCKLWTQRQRIPCTSFGTYYGVSHLIHPIKSLLTFR